MDEATKGPEALPKARPRTSKWRFPAIWIVPLAAAIVAGILVFERVRDYGPTITIHFKEVSGLKTGQTLIKYRGVAIGEVTGLELSEDHAQVLVTARLRRSGASVAKAGAWFWIVRPEVAGGNFTGFGTVISGPEIGVLPGSGGPKSDFVGLDSPPLIPDRDVLRIVLDADNVKSLRAGAPVFYRGVEVGAVHDIRLSANARSARIQVYVKRGYANLVREDSVFWNASGVDINFGLLHGLEINIESLRSLAIGGVAFATPGASRPPAKATARFRLYEKPESEWLEWAPEIPIAPGPEAS